MREEIAKHTVQALLGSVMQHCHLVLITKVHLRMWEVGQVEVGGAGRGWWGS